MLLSSHIFDWALISVIFAAWYYDGQTSCFWCMKSQQSTIFVQAHSSPTHLSRKLYPRIVITISGIYIYADLLPNKGHVAEGKVCSLLNATKRRITAQFFNQHPQYVVQDKGFWTVL